jgi:hypothetical protein
MLTSVLVPLRAFLHAEADVAAERVARGVVTLALAGAAAALLLAGALVALADAIGFALAALILGGAFGALALAVQLTGRARRTAAAQAARQRAVVDLALAGAMVRSVGPFLPLTAFVTAFLLARRP